jgi:triacylglycerol lipase
MLAAVVLLVAVLAAALVVAITLVRVDVDRPVPRQDQPGPVLLVPGYGGSTGALTVLAERIRATGRDATVVTPAGDGTGDLREQADVLDDHVRDALNAGAPSVDVIGFSAGGVVARLWAQEHDGAHQARRVITLGAPHRGAEIAAVGAVAVPGACPTACQQLVPGSRLLASLVTPVRVPPQWLSVWTVGDKTVTPPESARLDGAMNVAVQSICPDRAVGHAELPTDAVVSAIVLAALEPGPLTAPTPGSCVRT